MDFKIYLSENCRKLDLYLYEYLFEGQEAAPFLKELSTFQNLDGGFGNAIEPDLRLPDSSPLATTIAFQYLLQVGLQADNALVRDSIKYFLDTYDKTKGGWINIPPSADSHPRAPWWSHSTEKSSTEWGNPSAEILGYLLKYAPRCDAGLLLQLSRRAVSRLNEVNDPEPHEIKCFVRLYENADTKLQKQLYPALAKNIKKVTNKNPKNWGGYVPAPLTFISSPNSPFADLFDKRILIENVKFLKGQVMNSNHWEPNWEWGQFKDDWAKAKNDWSGKITVDNLKILREFDSDSVTELA